jgi:hypothetical protein
MAYIYFSSEERWEHYSSLQEISRSQSRSLKDINQNIASFRDHYATNLQLLKTLNLNSITHGKTLDSVVSQINKNT